MRKVTLPGFGKESARIETARRITCQSGFVANLVRIRYRFYIEQHLIDEGENDIEADGIGCSDEKEEGELKFG